MSFKDKPLKKIVSDTRITIDAIHTDIVKDFKENKSSLTDKKLELEKLKGLRDKTDDINAQILSLESEIGKLHKKKDDEVDYYLETSDLLNEYYSKKDGTFEEENKELSVLDFMNKKNKEKKTDDLINKYMVRQLVKPGITGAAQIKGYRGETKELRDMEGRVRLDVWYIENWSLSLDINIIFSTVWNIFKGDEKAL